VATGCSSFSEMNFEVLRPAGYSMPPDIKSVVLVDNSQVFPDTAVNIIMLDSEIIKVDTDKVADYTSSVINTIKEELLSRMFFDTVYVDTIQYKIVGNGASLDELSPAQIKGICKKFGADAIISLDAYRYTNNISIESYGDYEYYSTYDASAINFWRIYDCYNMSVMNIHIQKDTVFWDNIGYSINGSLNPFVSFNKATHEIGSYLSYQMVDYLVPYWEKVSRHLYTSGNIHFLNATDWVNRDNWQEAEKIWNYIYSNGSKKAKIKAALNIALALEMQGHIEDATDWAFKVYEILDNDGTKTKNSINRYAVKYYINLSKRKLEYKKLVEQLGG
jgi:hypothetical protein